MISCRGFVSRQSRYGSVVASSEPPTSVYHEQRKSVCIIVKNMAQGVQTSAEAVRNAPWKL